MEDDDIKQAIRNRLIIYNAAILEINREMIIDELMKIINIDRYDQKHPKCTCSNCTGEKDYNEY